MDLGSKICKLRKNANISQEQLAEKLDVTRQTISNWELGQTTPDIFQAKEIARIFGIGLDELTDNDIKDILVEKINNTEKMATKTINILKILCITIICFLIVIIAISVVSYIKNREQIQEEVYQQYMNNTQTKQFYITVNNEKYSYRITYDEVYRFIGDAFSLMSDYNSDVIINYNKYRNYIAQNISNCTNAREIINNLKHYFEELGGTWEEIPY